MNFNQDFTFDEIKNLANLSLNLQKTFRYFNSRNSDCFKNHHYHFILNDPEPVGYGHLDYECDKMWLGMCVFDEYIGMGYGKIILTQLIKNTNQNIHLTVDIDNIVAVNLYLKNGFKIYDQTEKIYFCIKKYV
jgi:RimJ/RimL family protein N-acetyltransferase